MGTAPDEATSTLVRTFAAICFDTTSKAPTSQSTPHHRRQDPADLSASVPRACSSSQGDHDALRSWVESTEEGERKYNPALCNRPLPEPGIRCEDASVQLELSSPLHASTWQELAVSTHSRCSPPAKCHCASVTLPQVSAAVLPSNPPAWESSPRAAGRKGEVGGDPRVGALFPWAHCEGNKKSVSSPVLALSCTSTGAAPGALQKGRSGGSRQYGSDSAWRGGSRL